MALLSIAAPDSRQPPALPLAQLIQRPDQWALFLDFDGTLVDLAQSPSAICIPPGLPALLRRLARRFHAALAILTGRSLVDLDRYLPGLLLPAAGQHGAERRLYDGPVGAAGPVPALARARAELPVFLVRHPGVLVEDKGATLALHYRASPGAQAALDAFTQSLVSASAGTLEVISGKAVYELRPAGSSKGRVLEAFLAAPPFAGRRPLVLGDDVTDEDAFAAALARGGTAIKVGAGASLAPWRLPSPAAVRGWLDPESHLEKT